MNNSLTVVFSTRTDNTAFQEHIRETCGIEDVEILQHVNNGEYALTEIYNKGLRESTNTVVVFTHDDVIFETGSHWGKILLKHFSESDFGILGKAGATSIAESGTWWEHRNQMVGIMRHQGVNPETGKTDEWENTYSINFGNRIIETVIADGVFFAVHKDRIKNNFDENIKGFHFYDVDFSLSNHFEGVRVGVVFNITIIHKSIGETNREWEYNRIVFLHKWRGRLPYHIKPEIIYDDTGIVTAETPSIAVIILAQNRTDYLLRCIDSIRKKSRYNNYRFYISKTVNDPEIFQKLKTAIGEKYFIPVESFAGSPAAIMNNIVKKHVLPDTDLLLFCHDDIELLNDALSRCVRIYSGNRKEMGTVGIRLHLGNNNIQHSGIQLTVGKDERLRISYRSYGSSYNYADRTERDIFSNSGAFMMVGKDLFLSLGGFSEWCSQWLEDVELNFKALLAGKVNYYIGDAVGYHYEIEAVNNSPQSLREKTKDLKNLMGYIQANLNNPRVTKHLKYVYA